jgi:hypothetical protein
VAIARSIIKGLEYNVNRRMRLGTGANTKRCNQNIIWETYYIPIFPQPIFPRYTLSLPSSTSRRNRITVTVKQHRHHAQTCHRLLDPSTLEDLPLAIITQLPPPSNTTATTPRPATASSTHRHAANHPNPARSAPPASVARTAWSVAAEVPGGAFYFLFRCCG